MIQHAGVMPEAFIEGFLCNRQRKAVAEGIYTRPRLRTQGAAGLTISNGGGEVCRHDFEKMEDSCERRNFGMDRLLMTMLVGRCRVT